jgi:alkanesulfonate monooxygenase SsuD/methylene tetrahydromethanopterin reductase-like flavin-dependent oxidoreductase (luciferase family)
MLTTLDHVSGGRVDAGLGIGWLAPELEAVGSSTAGRGRRAEDYLRCLRSIWTDDIVDYRGDFYRVPRCRVDPKPVQRPHPPVLLGGGADVALRRAGRTADGWISSSRADLATIERSIVTVRAGATEAGRDPDALRFVCRGVVKVRAGTRAHLTGSLDVIRSVLDVLAAMGVTETFVDLNFDPEIGSPDADAGQSMRRAEEVLEALAPGA